MGEKLAPRSAYGEAVTALGARDPGIVVLDADLSSATMTRQFSQVYPERFFNMGIAECNMMGVAAGLAACGKKPFASTFAMFAAGRAFEQVRNSIAYPRLNVKVVGSHGGLSVGEDGATHQCCEDFALMRAVPNMLVCCPCDGHEMRLAVEALAAYDGPAYLRLGRLAVETVTDSIPGYQFKLGEGAVLRDGADVTLVAVGLMVQMALQAAETLAGADPEGRPGDGGHCHNRGAQHHRRPGGGRGRLPGGRVSRARGPARRGGLLRTLREGRPGAGALRPDAGGHCRRRAPCGGAEEINPAASTPAAQNRPKGPEDKPPVLFANLEGIQPVTANCAHSFPAIS